jgi:hypothetical protein
MIPLLLVIVSLAAPPPGIRPGETAARLTVAPTAAPKPALKYQLLPEVRELQPGNPAQWYFRCFMEQRHFFFNKEVAAERERYRTMPLKDLPLDQLKNYGGSALPQADWGARLDTVDWQVLDRVQTEGTDLALPEIGRLRLLAEALQVRFRVEVARRDFDAALVTAKTMLALARHLGECPTPGANRIGLAVADMALDTLTEMVQQPGCPNLYWALTDLPCPLVDLRKGVQGDRATVATDLRAYRADAAMTDTELDELIGRLSGRSGYAREQAGLPPRNLRGKLAAQAKDADRIRAARARLVETGCKAELVAKFPPTQVILLDEKREYEARRDDEVKLLGLAQWQIDAQIGKGPRGEDGLFADLLPRALELRRAQGRLEQRVAFLRHVEALRLYAADHDGKLPAKLDDAGVPLPADPFTGKPFTYEVEGTTAKLRGAAPKGEEHNPTFNLRYEIVIKK